MTEVIFILVILYCVYVVSSAVSDKGTSKELASSAKIQLSAAELLSQTGVVKPEKISQSVGSKSKPKVTQKNSKAKVTKSKAKTAVPSGSLRNPKTGEVAKIASSYRMTKRWIKEALVEENLLDRIYKTNELDSAVKVKIEQALNKLEMVDMYK